MSIIWREWSHSSINQKSSIRRVGCWDYSLSAQGKEGQASLVCLLGQMVINQLHPGQTQTTGQYGS